MGFIWGRWVTIALPDRLQIEVVVSAPDLEGDARARIRLADQYAIAEHAMNQVGRRVVQHDDVHVSIQGLLQTVLQIRAQAIQRARRVPREQDGHVDIAHVRRRVPPETAEDVHRDGAWRGNGKEPTHGFDDAVTFDGQHAGIIRPQSSGGRVLAGHPPGTFGPVTVAGLAATTRRPRTEARISWLLAAPYIPRA